MFATCRLQVRPDDYEVDVFQALCRLELDDDPIGHQEVQSMKADLEPSKEHRNRDLTVIWNSTGTKFYGQGVLVDRFQEPRAEPFVDFYRSTDYASGEFFML